MYELPLIFANGKKAPKASAKGVAPRSGIPLHEHTAFLLACGELHEEVDDRHDTLRGALEIDPLLATWVVYAAKKRNVELTTMESAVRWLSTSLSTALLETNSIGGANPLPVLQRSAWRKLTTQAVGCARLARQQLGNESRASHASQAYWVGMLSSMKQQLDRLAELNGHSPLHGFTLSWPKWLKRLQRDLKKRNGPVQRAVTSALAATEEERSELVSVEERELWFRPYPEFRALVPLLFKKLRRLEKVEESFAVKLQEEKLAAMQQLAYGASHEINNPLANISARAQTLMYNEHDPERRKKLLAINQQAFRAYEMIADLMLFAKPPRLEIDEVHVQKMVEQIQDELTSEAIVNEVRLQFTTRQVTLNGISKPLVIQGDLVQLTAALKAICVNGIEAMTRGGVLSVVATEIPEDGSIEISIEDSGTGLSELAQRHLFDPFFSGREAGRGLGFGLSKAWRIVEQHHGRIDVSSYPEKGSRFTVILPIEFGGACVLQRSKAAAADPTTSPPSSHGQISDSSISG